VDQSVEGPLVSDHATGEKILAQDVRRWSWYGFPVTEGRPTMDTARVRSLAREILALPESERQELAREILPALLGTRAGLAEIDEALHDLSDDELRTLVERARRRSSDLAEDEIAAIIAEGLRAA
jgi:hypothetical protein